MYKIKKKFSLCCSHNLWNTGADDDNNERVYGRCVNKHGHNYNIWITLGREELDDWGMVVNFSVLKEIFKEYIDDRFDHSDLNDDILFEDTPSSAENMAKAFFEILKTPVFQLVGDIRVLEIEVEEVDGASAIYSKEE